MLSRSRLFAEALADAQAGASSSRFVDLHVRLALAEVEEVDGKKRWKPGTDEVLVDVGGRFDRQAKDFVGEATHARVIRLHRGQEAAARWFAAWLRCFVARDWTGFQRVWGSLWVGGRRSGKTFAGVTAAILVAIAVPRATIWLVSPTLEAGDELDVAIKQLVPRAWYRRREIATGKATVYVLANGSRLMLRSGAKASSLKAGKATLVIYNEGQMQSARGFAHLRGAVSDEGSLCLVLANPPDTVAGEWVRAYYRGVRDGEIEGTTFDFDPRNNPWIEFASLAATASEVDEKTYLRDVVGAMDVPIGDVVWHAWSIENLRDPPAHLVDITARVTKRELGREGAFVIGVDLQRSPAIVGAIFVVLEDPARPGVELAWVVDEVWCEPGDEGDFLDQLEALPRWRRGADRVAGDCYTPTNTLAILDSSAWWQTSDHHVGRSSDRAFTARGWRWIYKTQKDSDANPHVLERCKTTNALLKAANGSRRLFVAPHCTQIATAMRLYENKHGKPNRSSAHAHASDACSYVVHRLWGRPPNMKTPGRYISGGKYSRADALGSMFGGALSDAIPDGPGALIRRSQAADRKPGRNEW